MAVQLARDSLISSITGFLSGYDAGTLARVRQALETEIDGAGAAALDALGKRLDRSAEDWTYYSPDTLARRLHHVIAAQLLDPASGLRGEEQLARVAGRPVVIFANHLSYSDANLFEILLHRGGFVDLADRLTVMAGPKVYSSTKRRFSSLCFGTIKTPQNAGRSSEEAVMNARDVARAARRSIDMAHERLACGDALLVFAEGTRSRTRGMQQMLSGVARYLDAGETMVLPVGITGTDGLFPVGDETVHTVAIRAHIGCALSVDTLRRQADGDRRRMMHLVGDAIARLLPPEYRGVYADGS
jgi:1-acyl-sn-glycerol-3-phosphate acyltransferase